MNYKSEMNEVKMLSTNAKSTIRRMISGYKIILVIILIVTTSLPVLAQLKSSSRILVNFSEPMDRQNIFDPDNYKVIADSNIPVKVIKVGLVKGDSSVVLFVDNKVDLTNFQITVINLKDKAGNLISADKNTFNHQTNFIKNSAANVKDIK